MLLVASHFRGQRKLSQIRGVTAVLGGWVVVELPWSLAEYEGPAHQEFDVSNATEAVDSHFNLAIHEGYGEKEVSDIVAAMAKIEAAYTNAEVATADATAVVGAAVARL